MTETLDPAVELLRAAARSRHASQAWLGEVSGITRSWVSLVLTGARPGSPLVLCRLAQLAGVSAAQMREAGRADIAVLLEATPTLGQASTEQLIAELYRRSREPRALLAAIRSVIEERLDLPSNVYRWLAQLADASTLADLLQAVTHTQQRTPDLLSQHLGPNSDAHPAVLAAAVLAACDLASDRELATLPDRDGQTTAHARANLVGTPVPEGITYPAPLERWVSGGELYLAHDPRDIPDLP